MILSGHEDLRVVKTVRELCDIARINKKTFYHYYETLDALLAELSAGYLARVQDYSLPEELDKVNREFFLYSAAQPGLREDHLQRDLPRHPGRDGGRGERRGLGPIGTVPGPPGG